MYRVRGYVFLVSIGIGLFIVQQLYAHFFIINQYTLVCDPLFSSVLQEEIQSYIQKSIIVPNDLCKAITKEFLVVKNVSIQRKQHNRIVLSVHAYKPLFLLNDSQVLLESGIIEEKRWYHQNCIQDLYTINKQHEGKRCLSSSMRWLEENADTIFDYFTMQWIDQTKIVLIDKRSSNFTVLCNEHTQMSDKLFKTCFSLHDELKKSVAIKKNQNQHWVADVRFDDQIILYCKRGAV